MAVAFIIRIAVTIILPVFEAVRCGGESKSRTYFPAPLAEARYALLVSV